MKSTIKLDIDGNGMPFIKINHYIESQEDVRDKLLCNFLRQYSSDGSGLSWLKITKIEHSGFWDYYEIRPIKPSELESEITTAKIVSDYYKGFAKEIIDAQETLKLIEEELPKTNNLGEPFMDGANLIDKVTLLAWHYEMTKDTEGEGGKLECPDCMFDFINKAHRS